MHGNAISSHYLCTMVEENVMDLVEKGLMLPLMEEFYTIQGEGYHKGTAAYFIRVGGCDVGCHWCDVKESWNAETHPPTKIDRIIANAEKYSDTIVITGGEPLTWDMGPAFFDCHVTGEHEITQKLCFVHFSHFRPDYDNDSYKIDFENEWGNILPQKGVQEIYDNYFKLCKNTKNKYGIKL